MSCGVHKALWVFVTIMLSVCDFLDLCISKLKAFCLRSYDSLRHRHGSYYEIDYLERCKPELTKIPKHLSIIVGPDNDTELEVLSKIAAYALVMDIDYISFFDVRGKFTLEKVHVPKFISSKKMQNGHFLWSMPGDRSKTAQLKYRNGMEKSIEVVILNKNDGKPLIAEVCRELFEKRDSIEIQEALKDRTGLTNKITKSLQRKLNNMIDPDCAIIFNKHLCTFGLLPWHTGFTEFHLIKTGSYFDVETFASVLYRFSKCEQRFGH